MSFGAPTPWQTQRAMVCERMGWTFDYYDNLTTVEVSELMQVWDGMAKAQNIRSKRGGKGDG